MEGFNLDNIWGKFPYSCLDPPRTIQMLKKLRYGNLPLNHFRTLYFKVWSFCEDKNSFVRYLQEYLQEYKLQHVEHGDKIFRDLCSSLRYCREYKDYISLPLTSVGH